MSRRGGHGRPVAVRIQAAGMQAVASSPLYCGSPAAEPPGTLILTPRPRRFWAQQMNRSFGDCTRRREGRQANAFCLRALAILLVVWAAHGASGEPRMNIVLMLADDLGWSDLGCYGADLHETPHLDRLSREGVRFTQAYAMPVCSPTRAALLTGKHAARLHMTIWREGSLSREAEVARYDRRLLPPTTVSDLPLGEQTLAEALKAVGYLTFHVGKWHLGDAGHSPETQGFDVNVGGTHWGAPPTYFHPFRGAFGQAREYRYVPGLGLGKPGDFLTDRLTEEALRLMDEAGDRPFFLNLWFHNPHTPIEGKPKRVEHFRSRLRAGMHHQNPNYAAMIASLDENVGRILAHLEKRRLADRTLVIFLSDNGGYVNEFKGQRVTDNAPLRSGKGSLYEGGIRVPLLMRLPGVTRKGGTCHERVTCMDLFRTVAALTGAGGETAVDGLSLVPLLRDPGARLQREALYFHYPHYYATTTPVSAVRAGDWKLLEFHEDHHVELYDVGQDMAEAHNRAAEEPDRVRGLLGQLHRWLGDVGAQLPSPTPSK